MEKSHVGLDLCWWCQEPKGVVLHRRLRKTLPERACYDLLPCKKCEEDQAKGITVIVGPENIMETGEGLHSWHVLKAEAIVRIIKPGPELDDVLKKRKCVMSVETAKFIGLIEE